MTYANFKTMVLSYVNRASAVTTSGSLDYVLYAMNDARRAAQRVYTFQSFKTTAFAQLSLAPTSLLTDFDTTPVSTTLRVVKQVEAVWEYSSATVSGTTRYYRTARVPLWRHSSFHMEKDISASTFGDASDVNTSLTGETQFAYIQGTNIFHSTLTTPTWYMCDVVEFMADHDGGSAEDIWLTYFTDWLKWATIIQLNQFLKDTERMPVDMKFVDELWESVKQFDSQMAASTELGSGD